MSLLSPDNLTLADRVRAFADEAIADTELYIVDVEVRGRQGGRVVDVFVDGDEGAGLDELAQVARSLGFLLDTEDLIKGQYRLNVSSPGADRPLMLPRQYPKHIGRDLDVTYEVDAEIVTVRGTLASADDDTLSLDVPGQDGPTTLSYDAIREAHVALPW